MKIQISEPILVYAPEMTETISRWGVYAIPRMWREPTGELVVRFNGEEDSADIENMQRAPNLYFTSWDNGSTWECCPDGEQRYDISVLTGIDPPYRKLANGDTVYVKYVPNLPPIKNTPYQKEFVTPCGEAIVRSYRWGDIPQECRRVRFGRIGKESGKIEEFETEMDFPERQIHVVSQGYSEGKYVKVEEYVQPFIFRLPYFSAVCEMPNGELAAVCCGQNPDADKYYGEVYLIVSADGGHTWQKRSVVAGGITQLPYGFGGDGFEVSLTVGPEGDLYSVMRMDLSSDPRKDPHPTDLMLCISRDGGYTWSEPRPIADSSVTPHIAQLKDVVIAIYGRPGVHLKYSTDKGVTWSEPLTLIGKTLTEERARGRDDFESKYGAPDSYCNIFWEQISDSEMLVLYNDLTYPDRNGVPTKAAFVRKIKVLP